MIRAWRSLDRLDREIVMRLVGLVLAVAVAIVAIWFDYAFLAFIAGSYAGTGSQLFLESLFESARPATKQNRRLARRVMSAVAQQEVAES